STRVNGDSRAARCGISTREIGAMGVGPFGSNGDPTQDLHIGSDSMVSWPNSAGLRCEHASTRDTLARSASLPGKVQSLVLSRLRSCRGVLTCACARRVAAWAMVVLALACAAPVAAQTPEGGTVKAQ